MSQKAPSKPLRLIVGLGNPGSQYAATRHNVGANWVETLAARAGVVLREETRFHGRFGKGTLDGVELLLLVPTTYMNNSGRSVAAVTRFYKLAVDEVLIAHDELAFGVGVVRLKTGGGTNGHNGLRDIIPALGNADGFHRLRIGVDHPGDPKRVANYLTSAKIPEAERVAIEAACDLPAKVRGDLLQGRFGIAMNALHTAPKAPSV